MSLTRVEDIKREIFKYEILALASLYVKSVSVKLFRRECGKISVHDRLLVRSRRLVVPPSARRHIIHGQHDCHIRNTNMRETTIFSEINKVDEECASAICYADSASNLKGHTSINDLDYHPGLRSSRKMVMYTYSS